MSNSKIDIVKSFLAAAVACDWTRLNEYCHDQFVVRESEALPYAGEYHGVEGFRQLARRIFIESFKDFQVIPRSYTEGEDHVVILVDVEGYSRKSGTPFSSQLAEVYLFEDRLIKEIRPYYWDTKLINQVLAD